VERVFLYAPIERLRHAEILDTPGFNAPDLDHARRARWAFEEAHVVLWLLDATGPLKESERQVLSELAARRLPIAALVNKRDRLKESDLSAVLSHVEAGLRGAGLTILGRPLALSARRALEAIVKGASPAPDTGWPEVEGFLESDVVGRSDTLRSGAIVSRASSLARALLTIYAEGQARADERARAAAHESARCLGAAVALREASAALAARAERELGEGLRLLEHDLRPLGQLDPARLASCRAYVEERTAARLLPPLIAALERVAGVALPDAAGAVVRWVLLGALAATDPSSLRTRAGAVTERAALACADELERVSRQAPHVYPAEGSHARLRGLAASLAAVEQATPMTGAGREGE
jgi:hypothetical protein